ncbi:hypothetical protein HMF3257_16295 [Spirosoma telluris]|uniref:Uncharacterized protein n=1 Tax=Spirosoma telluris TaxID=2183553 RepID=A0A327NJ32_9BACT|nr:hypothetical protein HMF3257_16295 [Spirosoma telluris]
MGRNDALLACSGNLRPSANLKCWPMQQKMGDDLAEAFRNYSWEINRAHAYNEEKRHGFINMLTETRMCAKPHKSRPQRS